MNTVFGRRLFRIISLFILALLLAFAVVLIYTVYSNLEKELRQNLDQLAERTAAELSGLLDDMDKISLYISASDAVRGAFKSAAASAQTSDMLAMRLSPILTSITIPNNASRYRVNLFNASGNFITTGIPVKRSVVAALTLSEGYRAWYDALPIVQNNRHISTLDGDLWSDSGMDYISLYREVFDPVIQGKRNGVIQVQCPETLLSGILSYGERSYGAILFDAQGSAFYRSEGAKGTSMGEDAAGLFSAQAASDKGIYGGLRYTGVPVDGGAWTLVLFPVGESIYSVMMPMALMIAAILAGAALVLVMSAYFIARKASMPLRALTESIRMISPEKLSLAEDFGHYSDEFANLHQAFDGMLARLNMAMEENVRSSAMEMQANIIALQSQMDPHFLYNMLAVIRAMSREGNARQVALTCDYLSSMLRYISAYDKTLVPIEQELAHCENYLKLMKLRFEENLEYEIIGRPSGETAPLIPRLSFQPIIENCFQHAFKKALPPWHVRVYAWTDAQGWYVQVTDNGQGITQSAVKKLEETLERFLKNPGDVMASLKLGGMGLINTIARLRLRYGEDIVYKIESPPSGGTLVTLGGKHAWLQ